MITGIRNNRWSIRISKFGNLPKRGVLPEGCQSWEPGVRRGRHVRGGGADYAESAPNTPPALRESSVRGLHPRVQVAFPPTMNADASLGFRCAHVAMNLRDTGKCAPFRFAGTTSRAHLAPKNGTAQRAKVVYSTFCTRATFVVILPMFALGAFDELIARGMALWEAHETWAPRGLAACSFARSNGRLSKHCGRAAQSLVSSAPDPLFRMSPPATPLPLHYTSSISPKGNAPRGSNAPVVAIPASSSPVPSSPFSQPGLAVPEIDHPMAASRFRKLTSIPFTSVLACTFPVGAIFREIARERPPADQRSYTYPAPKCVSCNGWSLQQCDYGAPRTAARVPDAQRW